jgi:hypothetical protein
MLQDPEISSEIDPRLWHLVCIMARLQRDDRGRMKRFSVKLYSHVTKLTDEKEPSLTRVRNSLYENFITP